MEPRVRVAKVLSGSRSGMAEEEYRKLGFSGYLSKPVDVKALEETIVRLLPEEKVIKL